MTVVIEDAVAAVPAAMLWTPQAGPVALSETKIAKINRRNKQALLLPAILKLSNQFGGIVAIGIRSLRSCRCSSPAWWGG